MPILTARDLFFMLEHPVGRGEERSLRLDAHIRPVAFIEQRDRAVAEVVVGNHRVTMSGAGRRRAQQDGFTPQPKYISES